MSGLFRRLSSRRSAGPDESPPAAEPGAADAPGQSPADSGGHQSLLRDPGQDPPTGYVPDDADTTRVLPGDPLGADAPPLAEPAPTPPVPPLEPLPPEPPLVAPAVAAPIYGPAPQPVVVEPTPIADLPA